MFCGSAEKNWHFRDNAETEKLWALCETMTAER
jgi:hypothetical protein